MFQLIQNIKQSCRAFWDFSEPVFLTLIGVLVQIYGKKKQKELGFEGVLCFKIS